MIRGRRISWGAAAEHPMRPPDRHRPRLVQAPQGDAAWVTEHCRSVGFVLNQPLFGSLATDNCSVLYKETPTWGAAAQTLAILEHFPTWAVPTIKSVLDSET